MRKILIGEPEGKGVRGRPKRRWADNIILDLREIGFGGVDWTPLAHDRDMWLAPVNTAMRLRFRRNTENFSTK